MSLDSIPGASRGRRAAARTLALGAVMLAACAALPAVAAAGAGASIEANPVVDAVSPGALLSPATTSAAIPLQLTRATTGPIAGFSVTFQLTNLNFSSAALGGFLAASGGNPSSVFVTNHGGGSYTVDAATLGMPCGSGALSGTLCSVTVSAGAPSGTGTLVITQLKLRDCANAAIAADIGSTASVDMDLAGPAITSCAPNLAGSVGAGCQVALPDFRAAVVASDPHGPVTVTQSPLAGAIVGAGITPVTLTATDALGNATTCSATFTASDVTPPSVTLGTPNGGEVWGSGTNNAMSWTASDNCGLTSFDLDLSLDSGGTWSPIAVGQPYAGGFTWTVPVTVSTHARVRVTTRDAAGNASSDSSDADFTINDVPPPAVTLTAAAVTTGNDADGTTKIHLSWSPQAPGSSVLVYRRGFGGYPRYDDFGGAEPAAPAAYPPPAGWTLAGASSGSSLDDELAWPARDFYYYVAYVQGPGVSVSAPSNRTGGTLNYLLGDVMTTGGAPGSEGRGDNGVSLADISLLGAHYGRTGGAAAAFDYLDVGPTTTGTLTGRPLTDQAINFEDLILFSIDYGTPGSLAPTPTPGIPDRVTADGPTSVTAGQVFTVHVHMTASGVVQGLSVPLFWDPAVAQPTGATAGSWLTAQTAVMMSPTPGTVDAALLGARQPGISGDGILADVTFLALANGNPHVGVSSIIARDAFNHPLGVTPLAVTAPGLRATTALSAATPNPFRTTAQFVVSLPVAGPMELAVYSVDGRRVRTLASGERAAGEFLVRWDGRGDAGEALGAGVYFARLETRSGRWVRPVALLK